VRLRDDGENLGAAAAPRRSGVFGSNCLAAGPVRGSIEEGQVVAMAKKAEKDTAQPEAPAPAPAPARPPADPRLKVLKKFYGKFLPKGPLRDRYKVLMERWNSGEDHGGVTAEELKALHADWKASREKPPRVAKA
jgi:hypothetical protein